MTQRRLRVGCRSVVATVAAGAVAVAACSEKTPSGPDDSQLPTAPVTVSLQLAWDEFASNLQVFGGFGLVDQMTTSIVARSYAGMEARTLLSFSSYPTRATVRDSTGTLTEDTALTFIDAYVVAQIDTAASTNTGLVTMAFGQTLQRWDAYTTDWANAVDSIAGAVPWSQPGGGAVSPISTREWDPTVEDSVQFFLDTTRIREWKTAPDSLRAVRIDLLTDGHRIKFTDAALRLVATSAVDTDTTLVFTIPRTQWTFIYDPPATAPADGMRVGGAPAWRTVLDVALPTTLDGPPTLCAVVGCPFVLGPQHVTYAGLGLRTRTVADAFLPTDTLALEVRPVLSRASLPKSPLGASLGGLTGTLIPPEAFESQEGTLIDLPITRYVQAFLSGPDVVGNVPPTTLAILAAPEPSTFTIASFFGPGLVNPPVLNLVLTVSPPLEIR